MAPFTNYNDLQDFLDALDLKTLEVWDKKFSKDEPDPDGIQAAIAIYFKEMDIEEMTQDEDVIAKLYDGLKLSIGLTHNVRLGVMTQKGRLMITNGESATFRMTPKGIAQAEKMLKK